MTTTVGMLGVLLNIAILGAAFFVQPEGNRNPNIPDDYPVGRT